MTERDAEEVDPEEFLRALFKLSPEDADDVRREAAEKSRADDDRHDPKKS